MAHLQSLALSLALALGCSSSASPTAPLGGGGTGGSAGEDAAAGGSAGTDATTGSGGTVDAAAGSSAGADATAGSGGSAADATAGSDGSAVDAAVDGSAVDASPEAEAGGCVALTVLNFLSWCSVSVAGGAASSAAEQSVCVPAGAVSLSATPLTGFRLGAEPWHRTSGDQGSGEQGTVVGQTSTATVTVGAATCVWVCCEFAAGGGCPATNQCP